MPVVYLSSRDDIGGPHKARFATAHRRDYQEQWAGADAVDRADGVKRRVGKWQDALLREGRQFFGPTLAAKDAASMGHPAPGFSLFS